MNVTKLFNVMLLIICLILLNIIPGAAESAEAPRISREELKAMIVSDDIIIIDVLTENDWKTSKFKIKGAVRENPKDVESWTYKYSKDKTIVFY
jgi:hypothetical protein